MNGLVARLALPPRPAVRALLILALCASAVLLISAVRERPFDTSAATSLDVASPVADEPPDSTEVLASYSSAPDGRELLFDKPPALTPAPPAAATPDAKPAAVRRLDLAALSTIADRITLPTLAPRTRVMMMEVTAYCPCTRCCGPKAQGITASGKPVSFNGGRFVAADTRLLKFHTKLVIPGYANDQPVPVIDRGGAIKGHKLDVYFPSHQTARQWGRRKIAVTVIEE
jgi:3D (Asp-Asp-Asp) domain-containing protein